MDTISHSDFPPQKDGCPEIAQVPETVAPIVATHRCRGAPLAGPVKPFSAPWLRAPQRLRIIVAQQGWRSACGVIPTERSAVALLIPADPPAHWGTSQGPAAACAPSVATAQAPDQPPPAGAGFRAMHSARQPLRLRHRPTPRLLRVERPRHGEPAQAQA